jgi:hypothetical protein
MMVYHTLLPSYFMASSTSDRCHTWALAELDLPKNIVWYFSSEDDPDQKFVTEDVRMSFNSVEMLVLTDSNSLLHGFWPTCPKIEN